jgi:hypothetical protein
MRQLPGDLTGTELTMAFGRCRPGKGLKDLDHTGWGRWGFGIIDET